MEFIDEKIQQYAETFTTQENEILKQLNRDTHAKILMPRMLSGHLQGQLLSTISCMIQPEKILEIVYRTVMFVGVNYMSTLVKRLIFEIVKRFKS